MKAPVLLLLAAFFLSFFFSRSAAASRAILKKTLRPPLSPSLETKQIEFRSFDWLQRADLATSASRHASQKLRLQRRPRRIAARPAGLERTAANFLHTSNLVPKYRSCSKLNASAAAAAAAAHATAYYRLPEKTPFRLEDWRILDSAVQDVHTFAFAASVLLPLFLTSSSLRGCEEARMRGGEEARRRGRRTDEETTLIKTSSGGVCCLTAACIFPQACIITVCLVCRSSQKVFRSAGV